MEAIDLQRIERNVFRDYCQDGLADAMIGAYFLLIGLALPNGALVPFAILPILCYVPLLRSLKKRIIYPRSGYAELRQGELGPMLWFMLGSFILGLITLVAVLVAKDIVAQPDRWYRWMPILFGIWLAGIFLGLGLRIGLGRYYVVAGVALAGGPLCALLPLTGKLANIGLLFSGVGAVLLACGVTVLVRFLRAHPVPTGGLGDVAD